MRTLRSTEAGSTDTEGNLVTVLILHPVGREPWPMSHDLPPHWARHPYWPPVHHEVSGDLTETGSFVPQSPHAVFQKHLMPIFLHRPCCFCPTAIYNPRTSGKLAFSFPRLHSLNVSETQGPSAEAPTCFSGSSWGTPGRFCLFS